MIWRRRIGSAIEGGKAMKLMLGKPDDTEIVLAQQVGGAWRPKPNLAAEMATFLQGSDPSSSRCGSRTPNSAPRKARRARCFALPR
jgi:hypothetical protein